MNIKSIRPLFNTLVVTMDVYTQEDLDSQDIIDGSIVVGNVKEYQRVVSVGGSVRGISVGDLVMINPRRYEVKKHKDGSLKDGIIEDNIVIGYNFRTIELGGKDHILLTDSDIDFVIEEYD